jgi:hypothetical protein
MIAKMRVNLPYCRVRVCSTGNQQGWSRHDNLWVGQTHWSWFLLHCPGRTLVSATNTRTLTRPSLFQPTQLASSRPLIPTPFYSTDREQPLHLLMPTKSLPIISASFAFRQRPSLCSACVFCLVVALAVVGDRRIQICVRARHLLVFCCWRRHLRSPERFRY